MRPSHTSMHCNVLAAQIIPMQVANYVIISIMCDEPNWGIVLYQFNV